MPKNDIELLYDNLRHNIKPWKNEKYIIWLKHKYPNKDLHHLIGSMGALKLTDALLMPLTREEHGKAEKDRHTYFQMGLSKAISDLQDYIVYLQTINEEYEFALKNSLEDQTETEID